MSNSQYNPDIHHRRSIRLKSHDYAGGGLYFVTLCAHREFKAATQGQPFGKGATCVSPEQTIIAEEWKRCGEVRDDVFPGEFVVMPDHFHGLLRIQKNKSELGHVIGAFKAAASRRIRTGSRTGDTHVAHTHVAHTHVAHTHVAHTHVAHTQVAQDVRIWHRNYFEMIVRTPEAEKKITQYICMNPWRCVQNLGDGLRGMGNPALWNAEKLGILCSRTAPRPKSIPNATAFFSGFHSPMEKEIFQKLLELKKPLIWCPAWGLDRAAFAPGVREALEENRMLILEMRNLDGDLAAAEQRNRFIIEQAEKLWLPHITPGGMLDRLVRATRMSPTRMAPTRMSPTSNHGTHGTD